MGSGDVDHISSHFVKLAIRRGLWGVRILESTDLDSLVRIERKVPAL